ncbi:MAG TPA: hypothetical protein VHZ29_06115 [Rhizomicrobium sp.]|nr:hypothetical protein [Rhizomicrobium sp.]
MFAAAGQKLPGAGCRIAGIPSPMNFGARYSGAGGSIVSAGCSVDLVRLVVQGAKPAQLRRRRPFARLFPYARDPFVGEIARVPGPGRDAPHDVAIDGIVAYPFAIVHAQIHASGVEAQVEIVFAGLDRAFVFVPPPDVVAALEQGRRPPGIAGRPQGRVADLRPGRRAPGRDMLDRDEPVSIRVGPGDGEAHRPPALGDGLVRPRPRRQHFVPAVFLAREDHQHGVFAAFDAEAGLDRDQEAQM